MFGEIFLKLKYLNNFVYFFHFNKKLILNIFHTFSLHFVVATFTTSTFVFPLFHSIFSHLLLHIRNPYPEQLRNEEKEDNINVYSLSTCGLKSKAWRVSAITVLWWGNICSQTAMGNSCPLCTRHEPMQTVFSSRSFVFAHGAL